MAFFTSLMTHHGILQISLSSESQSSFCFSEDYPGFSPQGTLMHLRSFGPSISKQTHQLTLHKAGNHGYQARDGPDCRNAAESPQKDLSLGSIEPTNRRVIENIKSKKKTNIPCTYLLSGQNICF